MTPEGFVRARIAEDEQVANDAIASRPHRVEYEPDPDDGVWEVNDRGTAIRGDHMMIYAEGGHTYEHAVHIARWDPHNVLKECAAKRELLKISAFYTTDTGEEIERALAPLWADHPDYQTEWAP